MARWRGLAAFLCLGAAGLPASAADLYEPYPAPPPSARFFPRSDGDGVVTGVPTGPQRVVGCAPRRAPVPTDAPDDPSYVGSPYGLGKPSYYGFRPPLGRDDPFGRPLRYCP